MSLFPWKNSQSFPVSLRVNFKVLAMFSGIHFSISILRLACVPALPHTFLLPRGLCTCCFLCLEWFSTDYPYIGLAKKCLQFLSKNKRHTYLFHQELYWTMYSPFCSTTFCHFFRQLHNSIFPKLIFLSKELFQVPFTVFQRIEIFSTKRIL